MHVTYVTHTRFPTEKAHGAQVVQVCAALAALGHHVTLLTPTIKNAIVADAFEYYDVPKTFDVVRISQFDALSSLFVPGFLAFAVSMRSYAAALRKYLSNHSCDLLYVRSPRLVSSIAWKAPVILELHELPRFGRRAFLDACQRATTVACLTSPQRAELLSWGADPARVLVEPDGVDLSRFAICPSPLEAKKTWKLPPDRTVIGYAGSLLTRDTIEKGIDTFLESIRILRERKRNVFGWIVGGPQHAVDAGRRLAEALGIAADVRFEGPVPFALVPSAISAFDVALYPAPASSHPFFQRDTSPLKVFEYLAAGKPMVAASIPPLEDVLDPTIAKFYRPGDPLSLAQAIEWMLDHPAEAQALAIKGKSVVGKFAWEERMKRILATVPDRDAALPAR